MRRRAGGVPARGRRRDRGYEDFQAVLADPDHPDRAERLEWAGGPFDPHRFDPDEADRALEWLAWRPLAPTS
nr:plasmid pRiA4b ORF-3 family protein [Pseudonocardia sp. ICBG1293]